MNFLRGFFQFGARVFDLSGNGEFENRCFFLRSWPQIMDSVFISAGSFLSPMAAAVAAEIRRRRIVRESKREK